MSSTPSHTVPWISSRSSQALQQDQASLVPTLSGIYLGLLCASLVASGFNFARWDVAGLRLHPYLIFLGFAAPYVIITRIQTFPPRILLGLSVFLLMFGMSALNPTPYVSEIAKVTSAVVTVVVAALLVRRRGDFLVGSTGLILAGAVLSLKGLSAYSGGFSDVKAIDGANENALSLYLLPPFLLAGFILLRFPIKSIFLKVLFILASLTILTTIFTSGNRSGWLGAILVAVMLLVNALMRKGYRLRGLVLIGALIGGTAFALVTFSDTTGAAHRLKQTQTGYSSDSVRINLMLACVELSLQNPIVGVSPARLPYELGKMAKYNFRYGFIDPHNVFGYIMAGSGLISFAGLLFAGWSMSSWSLDRKMRMHPDTQFLAARSLMRVLLILWCVRGMFTREILYSPAFCLTFGLAIGLCLVEVQMLKPSKSPFSTSLV